MIVVMFIAPTIVMGNIRMTFPTRELAGGEVAAFAALEVEAAKEHPVIGLLVWSVEQEAPCSVLEIIWSYMEDAYKDVCSGPLGPAA